MEFLFWTLFISILVDGFKLIIESFVQGKTVKFKGEPDLVTVIIPAHNEEQTILRTLKSVARVVPMENIIVVDDDSTDNTVKLIELYAPRINILQIRHKGKVGAIHTALRFVKTPYVLLLDADVELTKDFVVPTQALRDGYATAVSFNIVPKTEEKSLQSRVLWNIQKHEYAKSMQIGRRFNNVTKSVHCISGAAGLFKTERLVALSREHTTIFPGEDLERTLLELAASGEVIFAEDEVLTDVPSTLASLTHQRVFGWWPGLWRNIWLFLKIIIRRKEPARLRYEIVYELFSLFTDPLKILSLIGLIAAGGWMLLGYVYVIYLTLECLVFVRLGKIAGRPLDMPVLIALLFPVYSALQMLFRGAAFGVFVWKKVFTNDWVRVPAGKTDERTPVKPPRIRKVAVAVVLVIIAISTALSQKKDDWSIGYQFARIQDQPQQRSFGNHQWFVGYKGIYTEFSTAPYNRANLGIYYGNWWADARYRWESNDLQVKLQYEYWWGGLVPRVMGGNFYEPRRGSAFPIGGVGFSWYFLDHSAVNVDVIKEWGRAFGTTYVASVRLKDPDGGPWGTMGGSMTNFGHLGVFGQLGYGPLYVFGDFYEHYDFTNFDRGSFGVGLSVKF